MKLKLSILFLGISFSSLSFAQDAFTLEQALDFAYNNSMDLSNALIDEELMEAQKKEILGIGLPQIEASLDVKDFVQIPTSLIPADVFGGPPGEFIPVQFGTQWNADAGISASQILFSGDYIIARQSSGEFVAVTKKNTERTKIEVTENVMKAFYNVLINKDRMLLIGANLQQLEALYKNTQGLYNEGFVEQIDVDRIKVSRNNLITEKQKMEKLVDLSLNLLKYQMNYDLNKDLEILGNLEDFDLNPSAELPDYTNNRIEWSLLESQTNIAQLIIKRDKFAYLPSLVAYGSYSTQAQRNDFDFFDSTKPWFSVGIIGAKLTVPIYNGSQRKYKLQQSQLELKKIYNQQDQLRDGIQLEVKNASVLLENGIVNVKNQEENVALAQSIYDTVVKKYDAGVGSNIEVIEAETALKTAQNNYYSALYDAIIAKIELKKAKGTLTK